jgi:hypothetical protein
MAGFEELQALLHKIRIKLYPNHLTDTGKYIAHVAMERTVTIEEICANLRERGGFQGNVDEAIHNIRQFFEECVFLMCDGWSINLKYFIISLHVGGVWDSPDEVNDRKKHPIGFTFRVLKALRDLVRFITIEVDGIENTPAYINFMEDVSTGAINETITSSSEIIINGHKIKIEGTDPSCGLYLITDSGVEHKITRRFAVNTVSKIITTAPSLTVGDTVTVRIVTQYTGGKTLLKEPRVLESSVPLTVVAAQP